MSIFVDMALGSAGQTQEGVGALAEATGLEDEAASAGLIDAKDESSMKSGVVWDIFEFIDALVVGKNKKKEGDDLAALFISQNTIEGITQKVQNTFESHTSMVDQSVTVNKDIYIDCGDAPLTDYHLRPGKKKYTWLGNEIPGTGCINYGCCYDVSQTSQISLSSVNSSILTKSTEMYNEMSAELTARAQLTVDTGSDRTTLQNKVADLGSLIGITPDPPAAPNTLLASTLNSVKDITIENINKEFENLVNTDYEGSQSIRIEVEGPLVCVNECGEPPTAGLITQSINVDIATKNIVSQFISSVSKNYMELSSESDSSSSNVDMAKMYAFCVIAVIVWVSIYVTGAFIVCTATGPLAPLRAICVLDGGNGHVGGVIFAFLIFWIWKIISCVIRGGFIECFF